MLAGAALSVQAEGIGVAVIKADGTVHAVEFSALDRIAIESDAVTLHYQSGQAVKHTLADIDRINIGVNTAEGSIDQVLGQNEIAVWPTTVESTVNIKGAPEASAVAVYSAAGALLKSAIIKGSQTATLDLSSLQSGTYVLTIAGKHSVKIIKK